jgi:23S rRNA (cytidine1920-2'-O)/16S rRNA (cytidine1409-2'-O)-methyltransferase
LKKTRIDKLLVRRGLVETRERARALIMAGDVLVENEPVTKAGAGVDDIANIRLRRPTHPYVGRGGVKLQGAVDALGLDPKGKTCADIGSSTGGFTDCLLQNGVNHIYAVDVDTSQLDWKLRSDPRVTLVEGNARYMSQDWIPELLDLVTVDVAFISVTKIVVQVPPLLRPGGQCLLLVKPQFELGPDKVGKGGIVLEPSLHREAVQSVVTVAAETEMVLRGRCPSPITGKEGNQEFFVLFERP